MTQFLKTLGATAFTAYIGFITWGNLSLPQKHWVFDKLGIAFDRTQPTPISTTEAKNQNPPASTIEKAITRPIEKSIPTPTLSDSIKQTFEKHSTPSICLKTPTRSITAVDKTSIYRWTDKNGQIHFSDTKPKQKVSREVTNQYASDKQYFKMNLSSPERGLPTLLGEQLQRDVNAIFSYLSDRMDSKHLRQVDLNLKVFNTASGFEDYRLLHAPSLKSVAGFYTSINNEAVVMQQRNDPATRAVARHEAAHVINAGLFGRTPIWFNEGFAEYFGSADYAVLKTGITPANRYHFHYLATLLKRGKLLPLSDYLELSVSEWRAQNPRTMYAMAWSVIYILQSHSEGERFTRTLLNQLAEKPCETLDPIDFWNSHYPGGVANFERRWRAGLLDAAN